MDLSSPDVDSKNEPAWAFVTVEYRERREVVVAYKIGAPRASRNKAGSPAGTILATGGLVPGEYLRRVSCAYRPNRRARAFS